MSTSLRLFRSGLHTFGLAALLALALALSAPGRALAQADQPAAPPAAAQTAPPAQAADQGDDAFLHSPVVRSVAHAMHLPLDAAVTLLLGLNFAIIFFAIAVPLTRTMPRVIRKRSQTLSHELDLARKATADAQARLKAVEAQLAGLGEEIRRLTAQVEHDGLEEEKRIKAAMTEESARILSAAEQEIGSAVTQAKRGLRTFAADLAIGHAEKQIALTPETDRALIAEFVAGVAGDGPAQGGRN